MKTIFAKESALRPYTRFYLYSDNVNWSLDQDAAELSRMASQWGIEVFQNREMEGDFPQCVHHTSQFQLLHVDFSEVRHRFSFDYYHGTPGTHPEFDACFRKLCQVHPHICRIRVTNREFEQVVLSSGIDPAKVFRIPIGIDPRLFQKQTAESRKRARCKLGIPEDAVVIGSFQKDGVGWREGLEPKPIKGPDVFLRVVCELKKAFPNLWVLLTGVARGYVRRGLEALGIPYVYEYFEDYEQVGFYYQALDLYLVTSREEGGPKAVLESLASGVPLVSTRVGQARDLLRQGENGWLADVDDVETLTTLAQKILRDSRLRQRMIQAGYTTASAHTLEKQHPLWREYFAGYFDGTLPEI